MKFKSAVKTPDWSPLPFSGRVTAPKIGSSSFVGFSVLTLLKLDDQAMVEPEPAGIVVANERSEITTDSDEPLFMSRSTTAALSAANACSRGNTLPILSL